MIKMSNVSKIKLNNNYKSTIFSFNGNPERYDLIYFYTVDGLKESFIGVFTKISSRR